MASKKKRRNEATYWKYWITTDLALIKEDPGERPGGVQPPLFLDQTKNFLETAPLPFQRVEMNPRPSQGLAGSGTV